MRKRPLIPASSSLYHQALRCLLNEGNDISSAQIRVDRGYRHNLVSVVCGDRRASFVGEEMDPAPHEQRLKAAVIDVLNEAKAKTGRDAQP